MKDPVVRNLTRRLVPLYVATFFHGLVLWYVVDKLFMRHIGFDAAGIGVVVAVYSAVMLVCETPSGILADRWSRRGVLVVASVMLAISSFICGISTEPVLYIVGALVWALFFSLYSGTYDSIIYDTVKEETGSGKLYDKYFGRFRTIDSTALVCGGLLGGVVAQSWGLSAPFFLTIPLAAGSIIALWRFKEPQLHRQGQHESVWGHVRETFQRVLGQPRLLPLVALIVTLILAIVIFYEFNQLWFIALGTSPALLGPAVAAGWAASGTAGYFVGRVKTRTPAMRYGLYAIFAVSGVVLVAAPYTIVVAVAQFVFAFAAVALSILATRDLHDVLPSRVRAGASSALSTLARILVIPTSLLFGAVSMNMGVFTAAWILVALALVAFVLELSRPAKKA